MRARLGGLDRAVQPLVRVAVQADVVLDQVEEHLELREEEHAVALAAQRGGSCRAAQACLARGRGGVGWG